MALVSTREVELPGFKGVRHVFDKLKFTEFVASTDRVRGSMGIAGL